MRTHKKRLRKIVPNCTERDFKEAVKKLILGFTYKKYARKGKQYFQYNQHNLGVTKKLADDLYSKLLELVNLSNYLASFDVEVMWNSTGKIMGASNISVGIYSPTGLLTATELKIYRTFEKVKIDIFFSDLDAASQKLMSTMTEIKKQHGEDSFEIETHKILNDADYKSQAQAYKVERVPTIIINDKKLENPTESALRSNIEAAINSYTALEGIKYTRLR